MNTTTSNKPAVTVASVQPATKPSALQVRNLLDSMLNAFTTSELTRSDTAKMIRGALGKTPAYAEYMEFREQAIDDNTDRKVMWNNAIATAKADFSFIVPQSDGAGAVVTQAKRSKTEAAAMAYLTANNGARPTLQAVEKAAGIVATVKDAELKADASVIISAAKLFDKNCRVEASALREELRELIKEASVEALRSAVIALRIKAQPAAKAKSAK